MLRRRLDDGRRWRSALLVGLLGLAITGVAAVLAFHADAREDRARDDETRAQAVGALQLLTSGFENRLLDVRGLYVASSDVSAAEFHAFTQPMIAARSSYALYWLQKVTPAGRAGFEREVGVPVRTFVRGKIAEVTGPGAGFPVRYATTRDQLGGKITLGYDAFNDPTRRATMQRAILSGTPQSTPIVDFVKTTRSGLVVYVPVYRVAGRHTLANTIGLAVGSFTIAEARAAVREMATPGAAVRVEIDGREAFDTGNVDPASPSTSFAFGGRTWAVQTQTADASGLRLGPVAALGGLLLTLLAVLGRWWRTSRVVLEGRRDRAERRFRQVFAAAPVGMTLVDRSGAVLQVNQAICDLTGRTEAELLAFRGHDAALAEDRDRLIAAFLEARTRPGESIATEVRVHTTRGARWTEQHVTFLGDEQVMLIQTVDIDERRRFEAQLVHQAEHDSLTGLLNRRGLTRVLAERREHGGAVVLLDLDHFKAINDLHGHEAGDDVLIEAAARIAHVVRDGDTVARMGGDEFALLLSGADEAGARATAQRLVEAFDEAPFVSDSGCHTVTVSVGVAMLSPTMPEPDDALVAADLAMYDAKAAGRGRSAVYDETSTRSHTRDRLLAVAQIRSALAESRLFLVAQPIRHLRTGAVVYHELLLRMREPDGRVLAPGAFLHVAEEFGLIGEIDLWVARNAIAILGLHQDRDLAFHVNLSGRSLGDPLLLAKIHAEIERTGVDPRKLVFEITETTAVGNFEQARAFATGLKAIGCRLALDDFGAGFSSFLYLKELPFDILKIDGAFVRQCTTTPADRVILESLVHTAAGLGKETVAEFVEDQETEDLLRELGVDLVQGYHVGRPTDVHEAIAALVRATAGRGE
ncbi:EAL domain-containing protein [Solirubrobacter phytolaccae]|uniref:EAL domain-containing protein n=1 Tax=Solirubrobacter phytolaccae TaxID=1404360 RepID=A0A9X3N9P5_9ACTN|nr:EAL domain-containing protein [Solirubrobacter phytolaccae]MDA0180999.1 EAL domain-containing protein [Solirubrobacter phytolaccae]